MLINCVISNQRKLLSFMRLTCYLYVGSLGFCLYQMWISSRIPKLPSQCLLHFPFCVFFPLLRWYRTKKYTIKFVWTTTSHLRIGFISCYHNSFVYDNEKQPNHQNGKKNQEKKQISSQSNNRKIDYQKEFGAKEKKKTANQNTFGLEWQ